jgi:hypothetical protein
MYKEFYIPRVLDIIFALRVIVFDEYKFSEAGLPPRSPIQVDSLILLERFCLLERY